MVLEGKLVLLREEKLSDMETFVALRNDLDTQAWSKALPPDYTLPMYQQRFNEKKFSYDRSSARFTIEHKETKEIVGTISYDEYEERFSATIGIVTAKKFWGQGLAFDAQETLLKFLFTELGVRVVRIWTQSGNTGAVRLAKRSGFKISGRIRKSTYLHGNIYDNLVADLLREEYFELHPELQDNLPAI